VYNQHFRQPGEGRASAFGCAGRRVLVSFGMQVKPCRGLRRGDGTGMLCNLKGTNEHTLAELNLR
jgi:hypothetical protein